MRVLVYLLPFLFCFELQAQTYTQPGFSQVLVEDNLNFPTAMAFAPDGRIFVASQNGKLNVIKNNVLLADPFISLTVNSSGERGLIGVTLDPDFPTNHYIYLYHTVPGSPPHNRITRYTANGDVALGGSDTVILDLDPLSSATNHNGGAMHFGLDGKLYVAVGENANGSNAQDLDTYHGKLLRINPDGSVPTGNPFTTGSEQRRRVWSYGLRNPYTFSVQPLTGKIYVNDVGQSTWEEINDATTGGLNFGWPSAEGMSTNPAYTNPLFVYPHGSGNAAGCALTGGTFFNPSSTNYPDEYLGRYFYQEYCNNWIGVIDFSGTSPVSQLFASNISGSGLAIDVGTDGNLYYLSRSASALYKIIYTPTTTAPAITGQPSNATIAEGGTATFSVSVSGTQPFTYQWQKNNTDIDGAENATYSITNAVMSDAGMYRVIVTNAAGSVTSNNATLTVLANKPPVAIITKPTDVELYTAGTSIEFSGNATDEEDGELPASAFSWAINFHHDTHQHDQPSLGGIKSGTFDVPDEGETSDNVWYRFILTVTDSKGLVGKDSVDVFPRKSTIALHTDPEGLQVTLDGQPKVTPASVLSVEGLKRSIDVISPQEHEGQTYIFDSWSNGGDAQQTFATPADDINLTAKFTLVVGVAREQQTGGLIAYPNPVNGNFLTVIFDSPRAQRIKISISTLIAGEVEGTVHDVVQGKNQLTIPVSSLRDGIYVLTLESPEGKIMTKINRVR